MMQAASLILRDPTLRLTALAMILIGTINASLFPYQSLIAIDRIGLGESSYALLLVVASAVAVTSSVGFGIVADQRANRRRIAALAAAGTVAGPVLMLLAPGPVSLVLCHGILVPLSASLYGQCFALTRLVFQNRPEGQDAVLSVLRALLSLTFLVVLPLWSVVLDRGVSVMAVYALAALAGALLLGAILRLWPRDGRTEWTDAPSGLSLGQSLREIAEGRVLWRIALLGAITAPPAIYMVLISLVFEQSLVRSTGDVALFVALVAGFEVPFMLALPFALRHASRKTLIAAGGLVYAAYLLALPWLAASPLLWFLPVLAGIGGAAILTLPIPYLQDLMADRPGAGSSLIAVQKVFADSFTAGIFAFGTALAGYGLVAVLGSGVAALGILLLLAADRNRT